MGPLQTTAFFSSTSKPMLINLIPYFSNGTIIPLSPTFFIIGRWPRTPNIIGTLGPYISASISPTLAPPAAKASARFAATVLFPTPPFPLTTAMIFLTFGKRAPLSDLLVVVFAVKFTRTFAFLSTSSFTALTHALLIMSFNGQAGVVSTTVKETSLSLITTSFTMFNVTMSFPRSCSCTLIKSLNTCSDVIKEDFVKNYLSASKNAFWGWYFVKIFLALVLYLKF